MAAQKAKPRANRGTDIKAVAAMAAGGLQVTEIARQFGCSHSNISQILRRYNLKKNHIDTFKEHRADIFAGIQDKVLSSISLADIKKASLKDKTILLGTVFDKEQVLTGHGAGQNTIGVMVSIACKVGEKTGERVSQVAVEVRSGQQSGQIIDVNSTPTNNIKEIGHDGNER